MFTRHVSWAWPHCRLSAAMCGYWLLYWTAWFQMYGDGGVCWRQTQAGGLVEQGGFKWMDMKRCDFGCFSDSLLAWRLWWEHLLEGSLTLFLLPQGVSESAPCWCTRHTGTLFLLSAAPPHPHAVPSFLGPPYLAQCPVCGEHRYVL